MASRAGTAQTEAVASASVSASSTPSRAWGHRRNQQSAGPYPTVAETCPDLAVCRRFAFRKLATVRPIDIRRNTENRRKCGSIGTEDLFSTECEQPDQLRGLKTPVRPISRQILPNRSENESLPLRQHAFPRSDRHNRIAATCRVRGKDVTISRKSQPAWHRRSTEGKWRTRSDSNARPSDS